MVIEFLPTFSWLIRLIRLPISVRLCLIAIWLTSISSVKKILRYKKLYSFFLKFNYTHKNQITSGSVRHLANTGKTITLVVTVVNLYIPRSSNWYWDTDTGNWSTFNYFQVLIYLHIFTNYHKNIRTSWSLN